MAEVGGKAVSETQFEVIEFGVLAKGGGIGICYKIQCSAALALASLKLLWLDER